MIGCGLVDKDIYCFGGVPAVGDNTLADNTTMMIDLTICNGNTAAEIKDRWFTETPNTNGVDTQPRSFPQNIALPDGHRFLLSGGFNGRSGSLADQTIVYEVLTKKWSKYANFEDGSFGNRQMYTISLTSRVMHIWSVDFFIDIMLQQYRFLILVSAFTVVSNSE